MSGKVVDNILDRLNVLITQGRYENLESDTVEIKSVPPDGAQWKELYKSANAFLNTRGGILILGIIEENISGAKAYRFTGYHEHAEPKLKELSKQFTDSQNNRMDLSDCFPQFELKRFMEGDVVVIYVDELAADRKYCFYNNEAFKRILTGDHKITDAESRAQEEFKSEAQHARELQPVQDSNENDLDLDRLNEYIQQLNRTVKIETIKPDMSAALPFLERKVFIKDGKVTTLGMLVCGKHPDILEFRSQVHGYVEIPQDIAQDKQDLCDNILPLMENSLKYILRNIQVGVSVVSGGSSKPQYPEEVIRETVNNALAHRDYSINRHVVIAIKPGEFFSIQNPGVFRGHLLIETNNEPKLFRIMPEAKPRNPKLADVLRVYRKWEGRGIGMATLVNLCLQNLLDLPYYRLYQEEVRLYVCAGKLLDEQMERLFGSFDAYLRKKLNGLEPTENQKLVMSYLVKSEWANEDRRHTILLTHDNNHYEELKVLERASLIYRHPDSSPAYPVYIVDRVLMKKDYLFELRDIFGATFDSLDTFSKDILGVMYRFEYYSSNHAVNAKQASSFLWAQGNYSDEDIKGFDNFYRMVRSRFNKLKKAGFIVKIPSSWAYLLNASYKENHLG